MQYMRRRIKISYTYNARHAGAHYTIDNGKHYINHGELCECIAKDALGYEPRKADNKLYAQAHDIADLQASVKSPRAALTSTRLADNKQDYIDHFFATDTAKVYIWTQISGDYIEMFFMSPSEFKAFTFIATYWDKHNKRVRFIGSIKKIAHCLDIVQCAR